MNSSCKASSPGCSRIGICTLAAGFIRVKGRRYARLRSGRTSCGTPSVGRRQRRANQPHRQVGTADEEQRLQPPTGSREALIPGIAGCFCMPDVPRGGQEAPPRKWRRLEQVRADRCDRRLEAAHLGRGRGRDDKREAARERQARARLPRTGNDRRRGIGDPAQAPLRMRRRRVTSEPPVSGEPPPPRAARRDAAR